MLAGIKPHQPVTITFEDLKTFDFKLQVAIFCHIRIEYRISSVNLRSRHTGVPRKRCSEKMQPIDRRAPMPKGDFNTLALQLY